MTTRTSAVRYAFQFEDEAPAPSAPARLRLATPAASPEPFAGFASPSPITLRTPDLVADLRRARAARFTDRYEWLALRRRRAQIAARHALTRTKE